MTKVGLENNPFVKVNLKYRFTLILIASIQIIVILVWSYEITEINTRQFLILKGLNLFLCSLPLLFYRHQWGLFHPFFITSTLSIIGFSRFLLDFEPIDIVYENTEFEILTTFSILFYYGGYFFLKYRSPLLMQTDLIKVREKTIVNRVIFVVLMSLIVFFIFISRSDSVTYHLISNWQGSRRSNLAGTAYIKMLVSLSIWGCILWVTTLRKKAFRDYRFWICSSISLAITFLFAGSRSDVIMPIFIVVSSISLIYRRLNLSLLITTLVLSILLLGLLGSFRSSVSRFGEVDFTNFYDLTEATNQLFGDDGQAGELTGSRDFNIQVKLLNSVPEKTDYLYGDSYLALLTLPVPRVLWSEKPGLVDGRATEVILKEGAGGVPIGPIAEAYWNFGLIGVCSIFFLYGSYHRWLVAFYKKNQSNSIIIPIYIIALITPPYTTNIALRLIDLVSYILFLYLFLSINIFKRKKLPS
jgi:hypothetical protein